MAVQVVVPWRSGGCPHRQRAWRFCRAHYTYPVIEAPGPEPWSKGAAVYPAIERCSADIVVIADADVLTDGLGAAVAAVEGGAPWAQPHGQVHRLSTDATAEVFAGAEPHPRMKHDQPAYPGVWGGGIVVLPRETALEIQIDPRFVGWGSEDMAFACALTTLAGKGWRGDAPLYHLYHPPQPRLTRKRGSVASHQLFRRYTSARRDPNRMRALLEEARLAHSPSESAVHDRP